MVWQEARKMKKVVHIFIVLVAINLSACGRVSQSTSSCDLIAADMTAKQMKLTAGVSTQAETEAVFGTPNQTSAAEDEYIFPGCPTYWTVFSDGKFIALSYK
jgi:hypothetical protein